MQRRAGGMMLNRLRLLGCLLTLLIPGTVRLAEPARPAGPPATAGLQGLGAGPVRDDVPRVRLYSKTPSVLEGTETELDPTEPTLDIYLPDPGKATGAGVL